MASTYSTNLKIELQGTGDNSGTWGSITNTNLGTALEQAIVGLGNPDYTSDANLTISLTNSNAAQVARALVLNVTSAFGSLTATRQLIVPTIEKQYIVQNNTTGGQSITVKTSAGTGITVPNGKKMHLYVDGVNVVDAVSHFSSLTLASALPVLSGGTGVTTSTGTTNVVLSNSPTLVTPTLGVATATSLQGIIGNVTPAAATVTTLTATADSSFTSTGAVTVAKGTTAQRPGSPVSGMFRFNTTTAEFEGYNGTAFASVGGAALSNDTSTASNLFPLFASATTGTASSLFTSNAKYLYKPSTGELKVDVPVAGNGIMVNSTTVATSYTIASGTNGFSVGPITVASGQAVTVASGQRWYVV